MCPQSVCIVTATMFPSLLLNLAWRGCKRWANKHDGCVTSSTDNEYLVKSEGSVHRHNALTGQSSELINQNLFVSLPPADRKQTGSRVCVFVWVCVFASTSDLSFLCLFFSSPKCPEWKKRHGLPPVCGPKIRGLREQLHKGVPSLQSH